MARNGISRKSLGFALSGLCLWALGTPANLLACLHPPFNYKGTLTATTQEALIYEHDGLAHLIIRTSLAADGPLPKSLAWVLPLPSMPIRYRVADNALFGQLAEGLRVKYKKYRGHQAPASRAGGIAVHAPLRVGDYEIQPIGILSDDAGGALNHWLRSHGFGSMPVENQRYYLHKGAAFLALRFRGLRGNLAEVQPLHIVYPSRRAYLPIKFSLRPFDLTLYTITDQAPDRNAMAAYRLQPSGMQVDLDSVYARRLPLLFKALGRHLHGYLTEYRGQGYNRPGDSGSSVKLFADDPAVP